ncbi:nose resistant to fluoxetine protein 6-like [Euwallacea similis]|uniref:nose resistant to fluoxetine protein 6-like n=1 Tax=Euwallacea similis TaxID=1736056 RepID=UPI00344E0985
MHLVLSNNLVVLAFTYLSLEFNEFGEKSRCLDSDDQNINNSSFVAVNRPIYNLLDLWTNFPSYIFSNLANISTKCQMEYNKHRNSAAQGKLNSLKLFDATAKPPSGILSGNINQFGDFDECLEVPNAQYCLALLDFDLLKQQPHGKLVHAHFAITETFEDPSHRVPGSSFVRWGFCIPKECSADDLINALRVKINVKAKVAGNTCQRSTGVHLITSADYMVRGYFLGIALIVVISSAIYHKAGNNKNDLLSVFAIQKNFKSLITVASKNGRNFSSIHGVRFFSALALLMAHKTMASLYNPYINKTRMTEIQAMKWSVIGRNSVLYTDCFLLISGLLNANALLRDSEKYKRMKFREKLLGRLVRILPGMVTTILFCTYILPLMGSGPLWPIVVNHHSNLCRKNMWRNFLFIHNYFGFKDMCLTHTHQLGIDMQLFLATPVLLYILSKNRGIGVVMVVAVSAVSTLLRFYNTLAYKLNYVVHYGVPISRLFDTADFSYILPTNRASIYLIGVTLADLLKNYKKMSLSNKQLYYIWSFTYTIGLITWFAPVSMSTRDYQYHPMEAAIYSAIYPFTWGIAIGWIIYASEMGIGGGWLAPLLTWKYFQIFTKIAYGVYLVQFPVFFYNVGIRRHTEEYKSYMMFPSLETMWIIIFATCLALFVEMPCSNLYKIVLSRFINNCK